MQKKSFLTENVSAIINHRMPDKYKDPGSPTISCIIRDYRVKHALLDLGVSVNLIPFSVYEQLGLGELKPTKTTLQLADRSIRIPRGVLEDVLVQVDKVYYPVDFIVLDTRPTVNIGPQIPVILGRPFLATSNAIINCRSGVIQMSFGNMTIELNAFNIDNQQEDEDEEVHEINMINSIVEDESLSPFYFGPLDELVTHSLDENDNMIRDMVTLFESVSAYDVSREKDVETIPFYAEKSIHISTPLWIMHTELHQPWDDPYLQYHCPGKSDWRHIFSDKYDGVSPDTCDVHTKEPAGIPSWDFEWLISIIHTHVHCKAGFWMTLLRNLLIHLMILLDFMLLDELLGLTS